MRNKQTKNKQKQRHTDSLTKEIKTDRQTKTDRKKANRQRKRKKDTESQTKRQTERKEVMTGARKTQTGITDRQTERKRKDREKSKQTERKRGRKTKRQTERKKKTDKTQKKERPVCSRSSPHTWLVRKLGSAEFRVSHDAAQWSSWYSNSQHASYYYSKLWRLREPSARPRLDQTRIHTQPTRSFPTAIMQSTQYTLLSQHSSLFPLIFTYITPTCCNPSGSKHAQ